MQVVTSGLPAFLIDTSVNMDYPKTPINVNLLVLSFLVFSDIRIHVEYLNKLKYECCQNSKPEKSIVYVDTDKENCESYRQNDRENQQYNRTFQLVHTNYDFANTNLRIIPDNCT